MSLQETFGSVFPNPFINCLVEDSFVNHLSVKLISSIKIIIIIIIIIGTYMEIFYFSIIV